MRIFGRLQVGALAGAFALGTAACGAMPRNARSASPVVDAGSGGMAAEAAPAMMSGGARSPASPTRGLLAEAPPAPPRPGAPAAPPTANDVRASAMLIYTASLNLGVYQVESRMNDVEALARAAGGYLTLRNDRQITVRVPRASFDDVVARVEKLGDVLHRDIGAQDVTDEFVDLETRLRNARAMRDRLELLLKQAAVKDALEIEKELGRITGEIERMEGRLKLLRDRIAFSTITVTFQPLDNQQVRDSAVLPFPWMSDIGLGPLLNVH